MRRRAKQHSALPLTPTAHTTKHPTLRCTTYGPVCFSLRQYKHTANKCILSGNSSESSTLRSPVHGGSMAKVEQSYSENLRPRPSRPLYHQQASLQRAQAPVGHHRHCGLLNAQLDFRHRPEAAPSTIRRTSNAATEPIRHALPSNRLIRLQGWLRRQLPYTDKRQRGYWGGFNPSGSKREIGTPRRSQSAISTLDSRGWAGQAMCVPCDGMAQEQYSGISTSPPVWKGTSGGGFGGREDSDMRADTSFLSRKDGHAQKD